MLTSQPIGIFDSGLGGLSILKAVRGLLPHASLIYCADSRYAPYGEQTDAFITARTIAIDHWLQSQGIKALVIACNTATAHGIDTLRTKTKYPIIGVEPGIKPAAQASRSGIIGVLATVATLRSEKFQQLLAKHAAEERRFLCQAGHGLVERIETGDIDSPTIINLLETYLQPMLTQGADTLVLGCTHYPFLIPAIRTLVGDSLTIIDTGMAIAKQLVRELETSGLIDGPENFDLMKVRKNQKFLQEKFTPHGQLSLYATANTLSMQAMVDKLMTEAPVVHRLTIDDVTT
ncbi:glutamate racemase [Candidatus Pandoraea novymonadis]|uniref:Glutamate racemase n=1 Tax=Candidatus Pandoraea novymonadis TaxID=1808959 RepID=A0ABX5FEX2_9BURK|nr:glutamate racemase [Candidatus Pandoraea novymonadis]PSB91687.1 Glutamate racemase 2 [Candidatus Pandoraea novymonadis]